MRIREGLWAAWILICVSIALGGCSTVQTNSVKMYPPEALLADCKTGPLSFETNEALADSAIKLSAALRLCNNDKKALREWTAD